MAALALQSRCRPDDRHWKRPLPDAFEGWRLFLVLRGKCIRRQHDNCRAWEKVEKPCKVLVITPAEAAQIETVAAGLIELYSCASS